MSAWPKHPDGRPMKMGEMTPEQRKEQAIPACKKIEEEFNQPAVQKALAEIFKEEK